MSKFNRRDFLKVVGAGSGLAATGCGRELPEKIIPYVVQPDEIVPGVARWYSGSCSECSAGCGTLVRTREGRAVIIEGNPNHPINKGGLCAIGQSAIQTTYDPDRIREPLVRKMASSYQPSSWEDAISAATELLKDVPQDKEVVFLTGNISGSLSALLEEFGKSVPNFSSLELDLFGRDVLDLASERCFGSGRKAYFDLEPADVIVNFGAGFLESWDSSVEYSRQWARRRRLEDESSLSYFLHIEPRMSLTASNADEWIANRPGSETALLISLLAEVLSKGKASGISPSLQGKIKQLAKDPSILRSLRHSGLTDEKIKEIAKRLTSASSSLVLAGGASASAGDGILNASLALLINSALGNIGKSVQLIPAKAHSGTPALRAAAELAQRIDEGKVGAVIVSGTNPLYTLPSSHPLHKSLGKVASIIAISTLLDETTGLAKVVLPLSTNLETWSDSEPRPGIFNLNQPSMQPLYKTQGLGDSLLSLMASLGTTLDGVGSYLDFLKVQWQARLPSGDFKTAWPKYVEAGGYFEKAVKPLKSWSVAFAVSDLDVGDVSGGKKEDIQLIAFPSVRSHDGSSANRPWLQEVPDPVTTAVWGSWVEMHPDTANELLGSPKRKTARVVTEHGAIDLPVYRTKHIHPNAVAVPIGGGHSSLGRFAKGVGVNPLKVLPAAGATSGALQLVSAVKKIQVSAWKEKLVVIQEFHEQHGRHLIRRVSADKINDAEHATEDTHGKGHAEKNGHNGHGGGHGDDNGHAGGHHDPFALGPQEPPKQMYKQMEHPLYRWGMSIDLASCTGCSACVVACYAENNIPVVGKEFCSQGREMSWIRVERYLDGPGTQPTAGYQMMLCQHCGHAPCEPVCPVYATYHNEEGLNHMVYNRCVGTRYCANNCSYKVRRFNWFHYEWPEPMNWQLNPDVTVREVGVMEKCSFCVQRIREARNTAKNEGREIRDGDVKTACQSVCPTESIKFGNLLDDKSEVSKDSKSPRSYRLLDQHINTQPAIIYLAKVTHEDSGEKHDEHHDEEAH